MKKKRVRAAIPRKSRQKTVKRIGSNKAGLVFKALPNSRSIGIRLTNQATLQPIFPGRLIFDDDIKSAFKPQSQEFWFPDETGKQKLTGQWLINELADADHYDRALHFLSSKLDSQNIPVLNHPRAVLETRRDLSAQKLSGIDNLMVPKCVRFQATDPLHFQHVFEQGGFSYPILIRLAGSHSGINFLKIAGPQDWQKVHFIPWGGQHIYMTQWVDFRNSEGRWIKLRLSITSTGIQLRHVLFGESWLIHSVQRNAETLQRELSILNNAHDWHVIHRLGHEIRERVGLDFFGVDLGWKSDQEFVLFEANASMSILSRHNMLEQHEENYLRIQQDVRQTINRVMSSAA
jgi:hypothetical protein